MFVSLCFCPVCQLTNRPCEPAVWLMLLSCFFFFSPLLFLLCLYSPQRCNLFPEICPLSCPPFLSHCVSPFVFFPRLFVFRPCWIRSSYSSSSSSRGSSSAKCPFTHVSSSLPSKPSNFLVLLSSQNSSSLSAPPNPLIIFLSWLSSYYFLSSLSLSSVFRLPCLP